ncbi:MoeA, N-terminal and linker domain-containing protein [Triangularia setosa]|uniref:molybdopterin adenylyltransferase n=1 Tax=Triangularia setosa TaxID=2587417 RepID=A0AAN6W2J0_9PEZI|nr:MoeA, N-terminal and linker domain-containing protein [Podospora setosa]
MTTSTSAPSSLLPFTSALDILERIATDQRDFLKYSSISVPLENTIGRTAACNHNNPESTPKHDTSAMDGFAILSTATQNASLETPVRFFQIKGTIAAGDDLEDHDVPQQLADHKNNNNNNNNTEPCTVEIMTGGIFPPQFDACVKLEDVTICQQHVLVTKPIPPNRNKRPAGSDMPRGFTVLKAGDTVHLSHIMPLASAGYTSATVELLRERAHDINGPKAGAEPCFLGVVDDDPGKIHRNLEKAVVAQDGCEYDAIITSGAVSKGRYDHVCKVLEKMDAEILFHGLAIRPGHPKAFFGLPGGNLGAAAACFGFLVVPYLRRLRGRERERFIPATLMRTSAEPVMKTKSSCEAPLDCFRHGVLSVLSDGRLGVEVSPEQSPAKLAPYVEVNCWVHFGRQRGDSMASESDSVQCYPFSPATGSNAAGRINTDEFL